MKAIRRFTVRTVLPSVLAPLEELATNLRWSWHLPTRRLFEDISPELWESSGHDPIGLLGEIEPTRLSELAADQEFVSRAAALSEDLHTYLTEPRWYQQSVTDDAPKAIGYFSPEFGISEALPQYSGGLGVLAGDHRHNKASPARHRGGHRTDAVRRQGGRPESLRRGEEGVQSTHR